MTCQYCFVIWKVQVAQIELLTDHVPSTRLFYRANLLSTLGLSYTSTKLSFQMNLLPLQHIAKVLCCWLSNYWSYVWICLLLPFPILFRKVCGTVNHMTFGNYWKCIQRHLRNGTISIVPPVDYALTALVSRVCNSSSCSQGILESASASTFSLPLL